MKDCGTKAYNHCHNVFHGEYKMSQVPSVVLHVGSVGQTSIRWLSV